MEDKRLIYWHLPGFYVFFYMNQIIIKLMKRARSGTAAAPYSA